MEREKRELQTKKFEFSKFITLISILLFIVALFSSITYLFVSDGSVIDSCISATAMTVTGGMVTLIIKYYMSKAKVENIYKIQKGMYDDLIENRLYYNEEMLKMHQTYKNTEVSTENYNSEIEELLSEMKNFLAENKANVDD